MKIHLHIERLVLEGVALNGHQREQLGAVLQARLSEFLLTAPDGQGLLAGSNVAELATQPVQLSAHHEPHSLGRQIGDSVGAALCGEQAKVGPSRIDKTEN